ncbi:hypothetical protein F511_21916 [Dorcoceras hygrometricum]|uniref:Uncharacterized protein n=1 Tax=Dorcoceras hygrometricum TaxID=472368 RepID=A0A2Z7AV03_9LAMI|nr:hypothetical protein F511_21916 [Dorcoceras hygrometricum]
MDHQQSHGYTMPPPPPPPPPPHAPPSAADPYQRPPPPPPAQHGQPWPYSTPQFQFQVQHSPSPPPPQWATTQPHSSDHAQYLHPPPPPPPYPGHQPPLYPAHHHYPQSHSLPPRPAHAPHSYTQDMGNGSWSQHQGWDYRNQSNSNEQDWAEKARAWAVAKAAADNQYPVPVGRPEEQNYFQDQYPQSINPQFQSLHVPIEQAPNYQQYPVGMGPSNRTAPGQLQESQYITSGQSSYAGDTNVPYAARDGTLSSEGAGDGYEQFSSSSCMHVTSMPHNHVQPLPPAGSRSGWAEEHRHLLSGKPDEFVTGISDQPLNFSHHFNSNLDQHVQSNYTHHPGGPVRGLDPTVSMSSNYAWTPSSASGIAHPPLPPTISSGTQVDHPVALPSPAPGHSTPIFPTGHGFQPPAPLIGASFGSGSGAVSHPTTSFSVDAYGVSSVSERPKKASVPNWLREEIIKNKAVITSSVPILPQEGLPSTEEDINDKFSQRIDHSDSKSIDSSRSAEDEDEDEDVEAARNAAINKEIKRVLTEVLLKVTDELFDEIATKVLNENDLSVEVVQNPEMSNHRLLPSTPTISTSTASAKVLIPAKTLKINSEDASEKSTSGSSGDVLGLGSYASDEEDDEIQISGKLNSKESSKNHQSSSKEVSEDAPFDKNGDSRKETEGCGNLVTDTHNMGREIPVVAMDDFNAADMGLKDYMAARELSSNDTLQSSKKASREDVMQHGSDISMPNKSTTEKAVERPERNLDAGKLSDNSGVQKSRNRSDKNDVHANNSVEKDNKEREYAKEMVDKKGDENQRRHEERHARTEREYRNGSKDKGKEKGRVGEKSQDHEARKGPSPSQGKERKSETRGDKRSSKENSDEKRHDKTRDDKWEKSRYKNGSNASRHKRHRSPSVGSMDSRKDNLVASRLNDSSDESSDASKSRRSRHSKRHTSPSPTRSRKSLDARNMAEFSLSTHCLACNIFLDKFRGLLIASNLRAGILTTLLLRLPGILIASLY